MKIVSAILTVLIFFLTVQPMLTNLINADSNKIAVTDKCCSDNHNNQSSKDKNNNCCNDGHCDNPFLICSNCTFINFDKAVFSFAHFFSKNKRINPTDDNVLSSYMQDFWHPPESV